ncbi:MAG: GNAT family N-acetyltransferase [Micropepsaceae bacterium]
MHRRRHGRGGPVRVRLLKPDILIRSGRPGDLEACIAIEIAAARRFSGIGMDDLVALTAAEPYMRDHGQRHLEPGAALLVAEVNGAVAGYAALWPVDHLAHLCEIDVHPDHGGAGVGRALMAACDGWARAEGKPGISLTTFIDVPWNGPWYARQGYVPYPPAEWPASHARLWADQLASALDCTRRHMMIKPLA